MSGSDGMLLLMNRGFYVPHRLCIAYAREDIKDPIPHFSSIEEWEPVKSTKMQAVVDLCRHFLTRDDAPRPHVSKGVLRFPKMPTTRTFLQTLKILIYQEYPSMSPLLRQVSRHKNSLLITI